MDVREFIEKTGLTMDEPTYVGKRTASWATGILDSDKFDCWDAILTVNGKGIPVHWDSSIAQCSERYEPNVLDFLEKVQAVLIHYSGRVVNPDTIDGDIAYPAILAFTGRQIDDLMDLDIVYTIQKEKANGAQRA